MDFALSFASLDGMVAMRVWAFGPQATVSVAEEGLTGLFFLILVFLLGVFGVLLFERAAGKVRGCK
jgi:hypothetical protein